MGLINTGSGGGGGSDVFPKNVLTIENTVVGKSQQIEVAHNLNITRAIAESGKYKVIVCGHYAGMTAQWGDTNGYNGAWGSSRSSYWANTYHSWSTSYPTSAGIINWSENTLRIIGGNIAGVSNATIIIQQMF